MADDNVKNLPVTSVPADTEEDPFEGIKEEMKTRFELLPEEVQKVIIDDDYQKRLFDIAKTQKMTFEELGILETETTMVLLGMMPPEDYRYELQTQLKKNDPEMDPIIDAVNKQVFDPIRDSLQKVYRGNREPEDIVPASIADAILPNTPTVTVVAPVATAAQAPSAWKPAMAPVAPAMPGLSAADKTVLEKTGVVISETPASSAPAPISSIPNRNELLKNIENPPKAPPASFVADKLSTTGITLPAKTTDYSIPKAPATSTPRADDPYREKI